MNKILDWLNSLIEWIVGLSIGAITVIVALQVFNRFVLNSPLSWPEELSRVIFIFLVFIGGALASKRGSHINIDLIDSLIHSERVVEVLEVIRNLLITVVMYITLTGGLQVIPRAKLIRLSATNLPMSIRVIPVVIGSGLMLFYSIVFVIQGVLKLVKD